MAKKLYEESSIQAIANAIRSRTGGSDTYLISEMAEAVSDLPNQYGSSDEGKAVHNGTLSSQTQRATQITENGTYDTTFNNSVEVNIESLNSHIYSKASASISSGVSDLYAPEIILNGNTFPPPFSGDPYIESSGSQYINTGYICNANTKVVMRCFVKNTGSREYATPFGVRGSGNANRFTFYAKINNEQNAGVQYGNTDLITIGSMLYDVGVTLLMEAGHASVTAGSFHSVDATWTPSGGPTQAYPLFLFQLGQNGGAYGAPTSILMRMYECSIYEGETLVHHYVPHVDENDVACLKDTVDDSVFYNAGTGTFTYGIE